MADAAAAAAEPEAEGEAKPKKPIGLIIGVIVGIIVLIAGTVVGTLLLAKQTGFFAPPPNPEAMLEGEAGDGHGEKAADGHGAPAGDKKGDGKDAGGPPKLNKKSPDSPRFEYTYFQLEREFLVNLSGSKKVMSVQIALMTRYDERVIENVKKHEFALRSAIMDAMRLTTEADLAKPDFRRDLAKKVADVMNTMLEKYEDFGGVEEINFTNFIVQ
ncbi:MAG: flagellar basal body-associated FliL family protein [Rhodoferax sp.]|nr:flagellar basal body-associated FliL family protein [Rhodoferax sp.]